MTRPPTLLPLLPSDLAAIFAEANGMQIEGFRRQYLCDEAGPAIGFSVSLSEPIGTSNAYNLTPYGTGIGRNIVLATRAALIALNRDRGNILREEAERRTRLADEKLARAARFAAIDNFII